MKFIVWFTNNVFAAFLLLLYTVGESDARKCDLKWVRLMFMLSCGRRKREVPRPSSLSEVLPTDVDLAIQYFKNKDPTNPLFNEDRQTLIEVMKSAEGFPLPVEGRYMKRNPKRGKSRIDRLLDRCCRIGVPNTCTGDDFLGAC